MLLYEKLLGLYNNVNTLKLGDPEVVGYQIQSPTPYLIFFCVVLFEANKHVWKLIPNTLFCRHVFHSMFTFFKHYDLVREILLSSNPLGIMILKLTVYGLS